MTSVTEYFKYFPVSDRDREWGTYILSSGLNTIAPDSAYPVIQLKGYSWQWETGRKLDDYQILLVHSGQGEFESKQTGRVQVSEGSVIVLFPNVWHRYRPNQTTGWTEQWFTINGSFPQMLEKNGVISPQQPVFTPGPDELILELANQIAEAVRSEVVGYQQFCSLKILQILAHADAGVRIRTLGGSKTEQKMREACAIMAQHMDGRLSMPDLADSLDLGYSWFRRMFKYYTGHPPAQYHLHMRLNHAKHLLLETNLSIKEIAYKLGFDTPHHFSRAFKASSGHSPSAFRSRATGA